MNAFLPKPMIRWKFYLYGYNLAESGDRKRGILSAPGN